jgi:hypothetical protein
LPLEHVAASQHLLELKLAYTADPTSTPCTNMLLMVVVVVVLVLLRQLRVAGICPPRLMQ